MTWNLSQSIAHWAATKPHDTAIIFAGREISWKEFDNAVNTAARELIRQGLKPGDRLVSMLGNRPEFYYVFFGAARAGGVFVPVNTAFTAAEIRHPFEDSGATIAVTEDALFARVAEAVGESRVLSVDTIDFTAAGADEQPPFFEPEPDSLVAICYTSGTTGRPKGAMLTHQNFLFTALAMMSALGYGPDDRHLINAPLFYTGGLASFSQAPIVSGGTIILSSFEGSARMVREIQEFEATVCMSVPALLAMLAEDPDFNGETLKSLRLVMVGAAPVPKPLIERYHHHDIALGQGYALTEGGGCSTLLVPADIASHVGSAGRNTLFSRVRVANGEDPVAPGQVGEIQQLGPTVCRGYWNNPTATRDLFTADGWLRTGDLGQLDDEGYLTVVGRAKDMIIAGGVNIYPSEIESVLTGHPLIKDVAIVGVPHEVYGETVTAVITVVEGASAPELEDIRHFAESSLANYKLPRALHVVNEFPRTASGKIRKQALLNVIMQ